MAEKRGKSIKELLTEMKDLSVLAIDLAYGAVLFNSKEIAGEVMNIDDDMDDLRDQLEKLVLKTATLAGHEGDLASVLRLGAYAERISGVAAEMANKVIRGKIHEIEKKALSEAEEKIVRVKIGKEFHKRSVSEYGDIHGMYIFAIKRKKEWIYHPGGKVVLKKNDVIFGTRP
ncbi:hypothetical protein HZA33_02715 [Candidatus Pacearchaeota archaeon]|nr:hypothetical protein [Candidatus Pacearchaeota archaeon]